MGLTRTLHILRCIRCKHSFLHILGRICCAYGDCYPMCVRHKYGACKFKMRKKSMSRIIIVTWFAQTIVELRSRLIAQFVPDLWPKGKPIGTWVSFMTSSLLLDHAISVAINCRRDGSSGQPIAPSRRGMDVSLGDGKEQHPAWNSVHMALKIWGSQKRLGRRRSWGWAGGRKWGVAVGGFALNLSGR